MRHYALTIVACIIVGVLAMAMPGTASQEEAPPPIELYESSPEAGTASAPPRNVGDHRADRPAHETRRSQRDTR